MAKKDERAKKPARQRGETAELEHGAPAGRGGAAMGRTVGLAFGGARPRKRKSSDQRGRSKAKRLIN